MKHKLIGKKSITHPYVLLEVELIPANEEEIEAINKVEQMDANEVQKELIENYLLFGLKIPFSILTIESQKNTRFILKAFAE